MMMTFETFVDLSAVLTGYDKNILKPSHDTQKMADICYETLLKEANSQTLTDLNAAFTALSNPDHACVQSAIMNNPDLAPLAQNIIRMWYLGVWYAMREEESYVISSTAYINGLVWKTMDAHPMGYSEFNFGYWETAPTS